jgi:nucleoside-diphosphate-sugar epimerase
MTAIADRLVVYRDVPVLVLGASGFIGGAVFRALCAGGARVHAVVRDPSGAARLGRFPAQVVVADLAAPAAIARVVDRVRPSIVFNLAGYGVDRAERDEAQMAVMNTRVVEHLCDALARTPAQGWPGLRLVHAGSALEYGPVAGPLDEQMAHNPTSAYGRTKHAGTRAVADATAGGLPAVVACLFTVYGPGEHPGRLLPSLIEIARRPAHLSLTTGDQRRDFTYVDDVVEGLLRLGLADPAPEAIVNLATGRLASVREFAETAARVLGFDATLLGFGDVPTRPDEMFHGPVLVARLERAIHWKPATPIADGIRRTWENERVA